MDRVLLEGKEYIKVSTAAQETGYTSDYIGQLCRAGKIDAKLVGRSWYVNEAEIRDHRKGKTRSNTEKTITSARELLKSETEQRGIGLISHTLPEYKKRLLSETISYQSDLESLIPEPVRKEDITLAREEVATPVVTAPKEKILQEETAIPIIRTPAIGGEDKEIVAEGREASSNSVSEAQEPPESVSISYTKKIAQKPVIYVSKMPMLMSIFFGIILAGSFLFLQSHLSFKQGAKGEAEFSNSYSVSSVSAVIDLVSKLK